MKKYQIALMCLATLVFVACKPTNEQGRYTYSK